MPSNINLRSPLHHPFLTTLVVFLLCTAGSLCTRANALMIADSGQSTQQQQQRGELANEPPFHEYKGVHLGMNAAEARKKLGEPQEKTDQQDFYSFSDKESAQVFYDAEHNVSAIAIMYFNAGANTPTAKAILGEDLEAKPDGSMYRMMRYPKAGYWVSYNRTAGDSPLVSVTIQKLKQ